MIFRIKRHVELLWEEFKLPIWVSEFDWNANNEVEMGDHTVHAEQIHNFYTLMFSLEVSFQKSGLGHFPRTSTFALILLSRQCTVY